MRPDRPAGFAVFLQHRDRLIEHALLDPWEFGVLLTAGLSDARHTIDCPGKIHRRRAARFEIGTNFIDAIEKSCNVSGVHVHIAHTQIQPKCGRHADRRRTAYHETFDRVPHLSFVMDVDVNGFARQAGLIDQADGRSGPDYSFQHRGDSTDFQFAEALMIGGTSPFCWICVARRARAVRALAAGM
jgi:hypothetical protein